jgi:hypothetical protein
MTTHTEWINKLAAAMRPYGWTEESVDGYLIALADLPDARTRGATPRHPPHGRPERTATR